MQEVDKLYIDRHWQSSTQLTLWLCPLWSSFSAAHRSPEGRGKVKTKVWKEQGEGKQEGAEGRGGNEEGRREERGGNRGGRIKIGGREGESRGRRGREEKIDTYLKGVR